MKLQAFFASFGLMCTLGTASAEYPERPVHIVVPFAPGGIGDGAARLLAAQLSDQTGATFLVENRTGAGGLIGYEYVARSDNNGYTLVAIDSSYNMYSGLYAEIPWNIDEDLFGISMSSQTPFALIARSDSQVRTLEAFVTAARADPGGYQYGSAGIGSANHAATHLFAQAADIDLMHIPYRGMGDALVGLYGGAVDVMLTALPTAVGQLDGGNIVVLGVASEERLDDFPDLPTIREQGVDYVGGNWFGLAAPKDTPSEIIEYLHEQVVQALENPDLRQSFANLGLEPVGNSPAEFNELLREQNRYWAETLREAQIQAQ